MSANLEEFWSRFQLLNQREKLMVVGALLLILWSGWDSFFYQGLQKTNQVLESDIQSLQNQLAAQRQIIKQLADISSKNPNEATRAQLMHIMQSVDNLKQQLSLGDKQFVPAHHMAHALQDMLKHSGNLKLLKLDTLPVSGFGNTGEQQPWMYKHTLVLTLKGDYFSTLNYLKALEALPWRILWDSIDYQVKDYPYAETKIQVYTLSFEKDWLGV